MTSNKQKLIKHLSKHGQNMSWKALASKYKIRNKKGRIDWRAAVGIWSAYKRTNGLTKLPKILIFDIETSPLLGYVWRLWKQNVHPTNGQLQSQYMMLCWSAKWLFDKKVMSMRLTPKEVKENNDFRIVEGLWKLLDEADIVIAHFGNKFDIPMANTRFLLNNLPSPSPFISIDTKYHASKHFKFPSNKLDYLGEVFGVGRKHETDFKLWLDCMNGDSKALLRMSKYCDQDVFLLEDVYLTIRPYIKPHPNLGIWIGDDVERCPTCGSKDLKWGYSYETYANSYEAFRCNTCDAYGRSKRSNLSKKVRKNMTISVSK